MDDSQPLVEEIALACRSHGLLRPGDGVLVAVSGGADSVALALLLDAARDQGLSLRLELAHLDHGWRGPDAAATDRRAVEAIAARLGAPLALVAPPTPPTHTEDQARRWRYRELDRLARERGLGIVATGHHLRDQAETFLMRLLRGSGPVGLRGIPRRRPLGEGGVVVVRPLLDVDPRRLRAYLAHEHVAWSEDVTNQDLGRDRARVRRRLLAWEERGGTASADLAALAARLDRRVKGQEAALAARLDDDVVVHAEAEAVEASRTLLAPLPLVLLDLALRRLGRPIAADRDGPWFTRRHVRRVRDLLQTRGALDLPRGLRVHVTPRRMWLHRRALATSPRLPAIVRADVARGDFDLAAFLAADAMGSAALDAERLGSSPSVRRVRATDVFVPWGAEPEREVGVLAWLAKRQVPAWLRTRLLVLEARGAVAWVPGYRVDRRFAVTQSTRKVAVVELAATSRIGRRG